MTDIRHFRIWNKLKDKGNWKRFRMTTAMKYGRLMQAEWHFQLKVLGTLSRFIEIKHNFPTQIYFWFIYEKRKKKTRIASILRSFSTRKKAVHTERGREIVEESLRCVRLTTTSLNRAQLPFLCHIPFQVFFRIRSQVILIFVIHCMHNCILSVVGNSIRVK